MRLINVETMKLEEYFGSQIPPYAIVSHCWGTEEVTFQDFAGSDWRRMRGASKIERSSSICQEHDLKYFWIDTCCIDKSSSAELSESINSMYKWYAKSAVCYAYLEDVDYSKEESIRKSRWFTRGWTLQELIAPGQIEFFDRQWILIGKKFALSALLSHITSIPKGVLEDPSELMSCSVARKMSWAAYRETTREEDIAYCLLGIFDVNMPLLYGEGARAFARLQEEILKEVDDQSLFAWGLPEPNSGLQNRNYFQTTGVLAIHPVHFAMSKNIIPFPSKKRRQPYSMTNKGLRIELPLSKVVDGFNKYWIALLDCHYEDDFSGVIGLSLQSTEQSFEFLRSFTRPPSRYPIEHTKEVELRTIFIGKRPLRTESNKRVTKCLVRVKSTQPNDYTIEQLGRHNTEWNPETMVLNMTLGFYPDWQYASSNMMFLNEQRNNSFTVIVAIRLRPFDPLTRRERIIDILPKPENITLDEWKENCKRGKIAWTGTQEKEVQLNKLPQDSDTDSPLTIKATITPAEILNQWIEVLDIEIRRDAPSGVVNGKKRDKLKILSYLK